MLAIISNSAQVLNEVSQEVKLRSSLRTKLASAC